MEYRVCKHCNMKVALTKQNPTGICPAYGCPENAVFYEQGGDQEEYKSRMQLTEKYTGLYFKNEQDGTFHFFYALKGNKMLFIKDIDCALYVINEFELENLADHYPINNLKDYR